jgi:hypothetical protein
LIVTGRCDNQPVLASDDLRPRLNPAQRRAGEALRSSGEGRPSFPDDLSARLRAGLEAEVADAGDRLRDASIDRLFVGKYALASVHACEERHLAAEAEPFRLGPPVVAGTVAHRAVQLSQYWDGTPSPGELVAAALDRVVAEQDRSGLWFASASGPERADVRSTAVDRVTKFLECFPPLRRSWRPVLECPLRAELAEGRIVVSGRVDLVLGRSVGLVAGKAFVDFKTGGVWSGHADDLRLYALIETLRLGVPPFRLASYYLDQGEIVTEDVDEALLLSAAARLADGVVKLVDLRVGARSPQRRSGPACRRCPRKGTCEEGRAYLGERSGDREATEP